MKTDQRVAQMGADMALQLMLMTLFRIVADMGDDPENFLFDVRAALLDLVSTYPLPAMPPDAEEEVRHAAQTVITGVMANAGSPQAQ
jgi:hypothetical protein